MSEIIEFEKLSTSQLREYKKRNAVIILSFGSIEQHSTHLPVGTDYLCSYQRAYNIAKKSESLIFSPLQLGYSYNHKGMFGTISLNANTMLQVVNDIFEQLCEQEWNRFLLFSGHNGNWNILKLAVEMIREKYPLSQFVISKGFPQLNREHNTNRFFKNFDLHAGVIETAIVSYYFPTLIDYKHIPHANLKIPDTLLKHLSSDSIDEIEQLLIAACTPQKTQLLSSEGNWGLQNPMQYLNVPVDKAMEQYETFYVELIKRWNSF